MIRYIVEGGNTLHGSINVCGAKNSALVMLACAILGDSKTTIRNCPDISDVTVMLDILRRMGCNVSRQGDSVTIDPSSMNTYMIPQDLSQCLRGSVFLLGALCGKFGYAVMGQSGGCAIGARPIDIHLDGLVAMGASITQQMGNLTCCAPCDGLHGANIFLRFASVGATENLIMAAVKAKGMTVLHNCAIEPEVVALQQMLLAMGADIQGVGTSTVTIRGVERLDGCEVDNIPDRIVTATYLAGVAVCGGDVLIRNVIPSHLESFVSVLTKAGAQIIADSSNISISCDGLTSLGNIITAPYPAFATDMQSLALSCCAVANGTSTIVETVFENRLQHNVNQLSMMGADIVLNKNRAIINGRKLHGCKNLSAGDLRGGAGLLISAMSAQGTSIISGVEYIDRGYCKLEESFRLLGANCIRTIDG